MMNNRCNSVVLIPFICTDYLFWEQEVVSSNLAAPTKKPLRHIGFKLSLTYLQSGKKFIALSLPLFLSAQTQKNATRRLKTGDALSCSPES